MNVWIILSFLDVLFVFRWNLIFAAYELWHLMIISVFFNVEKFFFYHFIFSDVYNDDFIYSSLTSTYINILCFIKFVKNMFLTFVTNMFF